MTTLTPPIENRLRETFLGAALPKPAAWTAGAVLGILPSLDVQKRIDPLLLLLAPAWFLYVLSRVYPFLRAPRTLDLPFVWGVSYETRRHIARRFIAARARELARIMAIATTLLCAVRAAGHGWSGFTDAIIYPAVIGAEIGVFWLVVRLLQRTAFLGPVAHDPRGSWNPSTHQALSRLRSRWTAGLSGTLSRLVPPPYQPFLKRQLLYIMRFDPFSSLLLPAAALTVAAVAVAAIGDANALARNVVLLGAMVFVFVQLSPPMNESSERLGACSYYGESGAGPLVGAVALSLLASLPAAAVSLTAGIINHGGPGFVASIAGCAVLWISIAAVGLAFAVLWTLPAWDFPSVSHLSVALLGSLWALVAQQYRPGLYPFVVAMCACALGAGRICAIIIAERRRRVRASPT